MKFEDYRRMLEICQTEVILRIINAITPFFKRFSEALQFK